jgi:hypothetical protein|tara:strand:+ start:256 stop:498 length:243 start_codon:yes stop_codon:yes gene_type:complete
MAIKGVINRVGTIGAKVAGTQNLRAKQVAIGDSSTITNITNKSINELLDVDAAETDNAILSYDASSDKWTSTTVIDGGTF